LPRFCAEFDRSAKFDSLVLAISMNALDQGVEAVIAHLGPRAAFDRLIEENDNLIRSPDLTNGQEITAARAAIYTGLVRHWAVEQQRQLPCTQRPSRNAPERARGCCRRAGGWRASPGPSSSANCARAASAQEWPMLENASGLSRTGNPAARARLG